MICGSPFDVFSDFFDLFCPRQTPAPPPFPVCSMGGGGVSELSWRLLTSVFVSMWVGANPVRQRAPPAPVLGLVRFNLGSVVMNCDIRPGKSDRRTTNPGPPDRGGEVGGGRWDTVNCVASSPGFSRCFPPGTPVSSTSETDISSSSFDRLDMTLAVAEALSPNKPNLDMTLAVAEALGPNKPNLDMTLTVAEVLSPNKPNLDMTLAVGEALSPNKPNLDMTLAVGEALSSNNPNLDMTLTVAEVLSPNKPNLDMTLAVAEALSPNKPYLTMFIAGMRDNCCIRKKVAFQNMNIVLIVIWITK